MPVIESKASLHERTTYLILKEIEKHLTDEALNDFLFDHRRDVHLPHGIDIYSYIDTLKNVGLITKDEDYFSLTSNGKYELSGLEKKI